MVWYRTENKAGTPATPSVARDRLPVGFTFPSVQSLKEKGEFTTWSLQRAQASVSEHPIDRGGNTLSLSFKLISVSC